MFKNEEKCLKIRISFMFLFDFLPKCSNGIFLCIRIIIIIYSANQSMASQAYKANMNLKKEKQAQEIWQKIEENPSLKPLADLHHKITDVEIKRKGNREAMEETNQNYQALKKGIKDFIRNQNTDKKKR